MVNELTSNKSFGGQQKVFEHDSEECKCRMKFGVFFPPQVINCANFILGFSIALCNCSLVVLIWNLNVFMFRVNTLIVISSNIYL